MSKIEQLRRHSRRLHEIKATIDDNELNESMFDTLDDVKSTMQDIKRTNLNNYDKTIDDVNNEVLNTRECTDMLREEAAGLPDADEVSAEVQLPRAPEHDPVLPANSVCTPDRSDSLLATA
jgi:hypothetical protein